MELTAIETCESAVCHPLGVVSQPRFMSKYDDFTWADMEEYLEILTSQLKRIFGELSRAFYEEQERRKHIRLLTVLDGLKVLEGLKPLEQERLLTVLEKLKVLEGLKPLEQKRLLTLMEGLKIWEQLKLLGLLEDLTKLKQKTKLLGIMEVLEPVRLLKLLERVGAQERENFYRLLVLLEPLKLKMSLERELAHLEKLESEVEKLERLKLQRPLEAYKRLLQLLLEWLSVYLSEDGDRRGGFRNLLLDGWWLEFWEIILLAAGDVERNPGPTDKQLLKNTDGRSLGTGDLPEVFGAVYKCRAKWQNLCLILGISDDDLSAIEQKRSDDPDTCLREGLIYWLKGDYDTERHGPPTWRSLAKAVDDEAGGNNPALASDIAEKHKAATPPTDGATETPSVLKSTEDFQEKEHSRRRFQQSTEFAKMFGKIVCSIGQSLKVDDLRRFLRYFPNPDLPHQRYIEPSIYEGAEGTGDILDRLYPDYINPENTYLLEEIVRESRSRQCKRLLEKYTKKYMQ